jgi:transposase
MTLDGISVQEAIDLAKKVVDEIEASDEQRLALETLIVLASIMKDRIGLNSTNSGKPPSTDETKGEEEKPDKPRSSGKPAGGQKDHKGTQLEFVDDPDEIIELKVDESEIQSGNYTQCDYVRRQVIDIKISRHVIEYRAETFTDESGYKISAIFPDNVRRPVQYGVSVKAHSVYMSQYQL